MFNNLGGESIRAYTSPNSQYVLALTYSGGGGIWVRADYQWAPVAISDPTFASLTAIQIAPTKAQAFVDLYDGNFVSVEDVAKYTA